MFKGRDKIDFYLLVFIYNGTVYFCNLNFIFKWNLILHYLMLKHVENILWRLLCCAYCSKRTIGSQTEDSTGYRAPYFSKPNIGSQVEDYLGCRAPNKSFQVSPESNLFRNWNPNFAATFECIAKMWVSLDVKRTEQ